MSRIRFDAASVAACEEGRPFSEAELQQLAGMKQRRMADLAWRQGTAILRAVMAHKVRAGRLALLCLRRYILAIAARQWGMARGCEQLWPTRPEESAVLCL